MQTYHTLNTRAYTYTYDICINILRYNAPTRKRVRIQHIPQTLHACPFLCTISNPRWVPSCSIYISNDLSLTSELLRKNNKNKFEDSKDNMTIIIDIFKDQIASFKSLTGNT